MRRTAIIAFTLSALGCGGPPDGFTESEWKTIQKMGPLSAVPDDPTNRFQKNDDAAALGHKFFFDKRYSGAITVDVAPEDGRLGAVGETGKVGCVSCHSPNDDYIDTRSKPANISNAVGRPARNSPSLVNVAFYDWYTWGGKRDSLWGQAALAPEAPTDTGGNRLQIAHLIYSDYKAQYEALFGALPPELDPLHDAAYRFPPSGKPKKAGAPDGPWELMLEADRQAVNRIMANLGKSLAAYETRLVSANAPIDRYVGGEEGALSASAKRGLKLFVGKAFCVQCHSGQTFQDGKFHNLGVPQTGPNVPAEDLGRFGDLPLALASPFNVAGAFSDAPDKGHEKLDGLVATDADKGAFRTKGLRNVSRSGPYYHHGGFASLRDVVDFYADGGGQSGYSGVKDEKVKPLNLTESERDDLVAFLESLTGEEVPEQWRKDPFTNP